jgi:hypothetical protein
MSAQIIEVCDGGAGAELALHWLTDVDRQHSPIA